MYCTLALRVLFIVYTRIYNQDLFIYLSIYLYAVGIYESIKYCLGKNFYLINNWKKKIVYKLVKGEN